MALVAHVHHGQTTLVDELLRITWGALSAQVQHEDQNTNISETKPIMDSGELEM